MNENSEIIRSRKRMWMVISRLIVFCFCVAVIVFLGALWLIAQTRQGGGAEANLINQANGVFSASSWAWALAADGVFSHKFVMHLQWFGLILLVTTPLVVAIVRIRQSAVDLETEIRARMKAQKVLEETESNLLTVFNYSYDAVFIHDENGRILEVNHRMLEMFSETYERALQNSVWVYAVDQGDKEDGLPQLWVKVLAGEDTVFERKCVAPSSGKIFDAEVALRPIRWYGRDLILAVVRDISDRKRVAIELEQSRQMLEHAQALANIGNFYYDAQTKTLKWSKQLFRVFGLDPQQPPPSLEEHASCVLHDEWERLRVDYRGAPAPFTKELEVTYPDGLIHHLYISIDRRVDEQGQVIAHFGTVQDVTNLRKAEAELRVSEEKFRLFIEQMSDGIVLADEGGLVVEWNPAQAAITGVSREEALGRPVGEVRRLVSPKHLTDFEDIKRHVATKTLAQGRSGAIETILKRRDGSDVIVMESVFPIHTRTGVRVGAVVRDVTDAKQAQKRIQYELEKLNGLRQIDARIIRRMDSQEILRTVLRQAQELLGVDASSILLLDEPTQGFIQVAREGFQQSNTDSLCSVRSTDLPWQIVRLGMGVLCAGEGERIPMHCNYTATEGFVVSYAAPIISGEAVKGVLEVFLRKKPEINGEWLDYLETLAGQAAIAIDSAELVENMRKSNRELNQAYEATIAGWSRALELRDKETKGHSDRVMQLSCELAKRMGISDADLVHFRRGVFLHDIGKMGIPDSILFKPGPLTEEEWVVMRQHPEFAYHLLNEIEYLRPALEIPYAHHERWNGSGYPRGLSGEEIPLAARIFAVVDVWDALIFDRPYRPAWPQEQAAAFLRENAGVLFDPMVVEEFVKMVVE